MSVHPTAIIGKNSVIHESCMIGPYCVIGENVIIGSNTRLHSHVVIEGNTTIAENCEIFPYTAIGSRAQDLSISKEFQGNVYIGNNVTVREQVTIHASTSSESTTKVGNNCFLMATSHIAHDCTVGNNVIMANSSMLAGHTHIGNNVFISGGAAIHQFLHIGDYSFVIACSRTVQDIPPYSMTAGASPTEYAGLNVVGLRRAGFTQEERNIIKRAYQILYRQGMKTNESLQELKNFSNHPLVTQIVEFVEKSQRGIIKKWTGRNS